MRAFRCVAKPSGASEQLGTAKSEPLKHKRSEAALLLQGRARFGGLCRLYLLRYRLCLTQPRHHVTPKVGSMGMKSAGFTESCQNPSSWTLTSTDACQTLERAQ